MTTKWSVTFVPAALLLSVLAWNAQAHDDDDESAGAFAPAVDTPIKHAPRPIIGALREPLDKLPQIENFEIVGHNVLPNPGDTIARGRNGPVGIADNCLYVGNRIGRRTGTGPAFNTPAHDPEVLIVDISNPRKPEVVGAFTTPAGATSRELRTIPDLHTLIIENFRDTDPSSSAVNNFQVYDTTDCRHPVLTGSIGLGADTPHEFFLWRDPARPTRFLIFASVNNNEPSLRVFEVLNPPRGSLSATPVATFSLAPAVPATEPVDPADFADDNFVFTPKPTTQGNRLHSMSVSGDGKRVYMANSDAGYFLLDSSRLTAGLPCTPNTVTVDANSNKDPNLCLRKINPDPQARIDHSPPFGGIHHSIYPVEGRPAPNTHLPEYAIGSGERNGTTTCPWTPGQILELSNEKSPQIIAQYMVPENLAENCFVGGPGDPVLLREFSTHQPLIFPNLFFQSWYSAGLRAWDISNPWLPMEVGVFVLRPEKQVVERFRNSPDVWTWPFPILHNGLVYMCDENSGLYILKYKGARADELPRHGTFLSNTNFCGIPNGC